jgi:hypothetical protein
MLVGLAGLRKSRRSTRAADLRGAAPPRETNVRRHTMRFLRASDCTRSTPEIAAPRTDVTLDAREMAVPSTGESLEARLA